MKKQTISCRQLVEDAMRGLLLENPGHPEPKKLIANNHDKIINEVLEARQDLSIYGAESRYQEVMRFKFGDQYACSGTKKKRISRQDVKSPSARKLDKRFVLKVHSDGYKIRLFAKRRVENSGAVVVIDNNVPSSPPPKDLIVRSQSYTSFLYEHGITMEPGDSCVFEVETRRCFLAHKI